MPAKGQISGIDAHKGQISGIEPRQICLLSVCSSHVLTYIITADSTVVANNIFSPKNERVAKKGNSNPRPTTPKQSKKYRHRRHIASRWSPCWSLTAAGGTIGKSIVLWFFSYPGFVYTTGVSGNTSILPLLPSSR